MSRRRLQGTGARPPLVVRGELVRGPSSRFLYPAGFELVSGGWRIAQTCFENLGPERVDPGQSTEALVGFNTDAEPGAPLSLTIDQNGVHYRIALA